jgi:Protein of unknown function (DUF3750)
MASADWCLGVFCLFFVAPLLASAVHYFLFNDIVDWRNADRSSAGFLPAAEAAPDAVVRIFSARTVRWRGIFATHSWIVVKPKGGSAYRRFDYTAWGEPIWIDRFAPDGRWFGRAPQLIFAFDGEAAERAIPAIEAAIQTYPYCNPGDYRVWPGPNSNTFVAAVISAVPNIAAALPPTAIGKDYPFDGRWIGRPPSGRGLRLSLGGYLGLIVSPVEGIELNLLGAVVGLDLRRPALKLPGLGRLSPFTA